MPFVAVDVVGLPEQTVTSELFGHETGAFTDARRQHIGYAERAHRGVLFLDEIGDIVLSLQVRLLRFLEERSFVRLGGTREIKVDLQLIAATNVPLETMVAARTFREDLLHRLKVFEVRLPPLREHAEDIPELCEFFLRSFAKGWKGPLAVSADALHVLAAYSWPGNVRQLRNVLESARLRALQKGHSIIDPDHLPQELIRPTATHDVEGAERDTPAGKGDLDLELARTELELVHNALRQAGGKKTEAWKTLGLNDRFSLRRRVLRIFKRYPTLTDEFSTLFIDFAE
jgi:DNA-binding NtrC family response regulator